MSNAKDLVKAVACISTAYQEDLKEFEDMKRRLRRAERKIRDLSVELQHYAVSLKLTSLITLLLFISADMEFLNVSSTLCRKKKSSEWKDNLERYIIYKSME